MQTDSNSLHPGGRLAGFCASLRFEDIPAPVLRRAEDLLLDWLGSVLAGRGTPAVEAITRFVRSMAGGSGDSELLLPRITGTPLAAAMANAAASHVAEQDDVHNGAVFHPAAVVFPPALAVAQARGASGAQLLTAVVAGYEAGIRVGEFLGRSHYRVFHTTGTAGTLAAAAAVGRLLALDAVQMQHAFGSAGTQAAGLWEFLREGADSKPLHTAHAAAAGLTAAYLAHDGVRGATRILDGAQGMASGMSQDADPARLTSGLGTRWALAETSFKVHASCRHTHPAADALAQLFCTHALAADDIVEITAHVHQGALDVLGPVVDPRTVHQAKFSMGTVLGLIAVHGRAGLAEFDLHFRDPAVIRVRDLVRLERCELVDRAYPARWLGRVTLRTRDGRTLESRVDVPKGDPDHSLTRVELEHKARELAAYAEGASEPEMDAVIARVWSIASAPIVPRWLPPRTP